MAAERMYDLEDRLVNFAVTVIAICDNVKNTKAGNHLSGQLVRSGTSPALNYGEAQAGESTRDFIHKLKIVLKELRESKNCIRIINLANLYNGSQESINSAFNECKELVAIFAASVSTAEKNANKKD